MKSIRERIKDLIAEGYPDHPDTWEDDMRDLLDVADVPMTKDDVQVLRHAAASLDHLNVPWPQLWEMADRIEDRVGPPTQRTTP